MNPATMLRRLDLPQPLGPSIDTNCRSSTRTLDVLERAQRGVHQRVLQIHRSALERGHRVRRPAQYLTMAAAASPARRPKLVAIIRPEPEDSPSRPAPRGRARRRRRQRDWGTACRPCAARAHLSTSSPPCVWESAPVTLRHAVRRLERRLRMEVAAERVLLSCPRTASATSRSVCASAFASQPIDFAISSTESQRLTAPAFFASTWLCLLHRDGVAALVPDRPGDAARLALNLQRLLRVARVLVREALALLVDLEAALGDRGPVEVHAVRRGDRAVALERAHVLDRGAERLAPAHAVALVADVAL